MTVSALLAAGGYVVLFGTVIYQMRLIKRLQTDLMERAEALLAGMVRIDGLDLPLPSDPRWKPAKMTEDGKVRAGLVCGRCWITTTTVVIGDAGLAAPTVLMTRVMQAYIDSVWRAHRNRITREDTLKGLDE